MLVKAGILCPGNDVDTPLKLFTVFSKTPLPNTEVFLLRPNQEALPGIFEYASKASFRSPQRTWRRWTSPMVVT